jgi:hypothetical protein
MAESAKCPNCGALYRGNVLAWVDFVKCEYCGGAFSVQRSTSVLNTPGSNPASTTIARKSFNLGEFSNYLSAKKGVKNFDPISGTFVMNGRKVVINQDGTVSGDNPPRGMVERWIAEYMGV